MNRREFLAANLSLLAAPRLVLSSPQRKARVVRVAPDRFDLIVPSKPSFRILQLTDTHFGTSKAANRLQDARTERLIRELVETHRPDFLFHTGDFINNDQENPEFGALAFMNSLDLPWSLTFGNHDHPNGKPGQKSLNDLFGSLGESAVAGYAESSSSRDYCFRIDLRRDGQPPFASLLGLNTGDPQSGMKVNASQTAWFQRQVEGDRKAGLDAPYLVMQHIPTYEYHEVFEQKLATGRRGEKVCFELDQGEIFRAYAASGRVRAVFCGHDHVNDYLGRLHSINLVYGRCSGYSGYGDWERGGRLIDVDCSTGRARTRVVLARQAQEKPDWSRTLEASDLS